MEHLEILVHAAESRRFQMAEVRQEEEGRDANFAIAPHEKHLVEAAFEDIKEKFENSAARRLITGYTVAVPVVISEDTRLGLHFGTSTETALDIDKSKPGMPPFPCTQVQRVDDDGEIGRWNDQQRELAGMDSPLSGDEFCLDDLAVVEPQEVPANGACGRSVWLQAVEVYGQPGFQKLGDQGLKLLQEVRWRVGGPKSARARLILYFFIQASYRFRFKARDIHGHALHVLAVHEEGRGGSLRRSSGHFAAAGGLFTILEWLVNYVDLTEECWFIAHNKMGTCQALHLAAGVGHAAFLDFLGEADADLDAKTRFDGKDNYTALHEAAFFKQSAAVMKLLMMRADVNSLNMKGQTPLHIAASQGGAMECRLLVKYQADVEIKDKAHSTALDSAMESGRYPPHKLFHLTGRGFSDLLKVALHSPSATTHLLKDVTENKHAAQHQ
ncbi:ankrd52 [Symbiodinium natans]|uniref:Ankrd52 protein n=1 Tax=Symbiodinium natans TaxID=878477 RepID=A0A812MMV4_9DINO|nr:ankrd52 [Symbiodinium natans]